MRQRIARAGLALILALTTTAGVAAQTDGGTAGKISVQSSQGRSYQRAAGGSWSTIYAGRQLVANSPIVTTNDAVLDLTIGVVKLRFLALSVATLSDDVGSPDKPLVRVALQAGAVELSQPPTANIRFIIRCPFGEVSASGSDLQLDGNRLRVLRGSAVAVNLAGSRRQVLAGEELVISAGEALPQPSLKE